MATRAPSAAKVLTMPAPMPLDPPVTTAIRIRGRVLGGRRLPVHLVLTPTDVQGQRTEMRYLDLQFDAPIPDDTFSLSRLERGK